MARNAQGRLDLRYDADEKCPPLTAIVAALQIFIPNTLGVVLLATLVARASNQSEAYLSWIIFTALVVTGASMIVQSLNLRYLGFGRLIVANFNIPFLAVSALALDAGGPGLLATLVLISTVIQTALTFRLASFRRIFTQTVSGIVVMLVGLASVPFIVRTTIVPPEGDSIWLFLAPGIAALAAGVFLSVQERPLWRIWILPITAGVGLIVALPLGFYEADLVAAAPLVSLPSARWPALDLSFGAEFWALLPVFVLVNVTAFVKVVGDLSVIYRVSNRRALATDFRSVQGGLNVYGAGTLLSGLLGTIPVAAPWVATAAYIGFTGIAAGVVGVYLGVMTILVAPFSKVIAALVAIPSPVITAMYILIFGALFVEGAKTVFSERVDQNKAIITGISVVAGMSAGAFGGLFEGLASLVAGNSIFVGSLVAIGLTVYTELSGFRARKLRVDLSYEALPELDRFLGEFATRQSWSEKENVRLRLVGEECMLNLLEESESDPDARNRRVVATIRPADGSAELEIVVASDDAVQGNIEDRIAFLGEDQGVEDERELSMRILNHYASAVRHRKYYGIDILSCRVNR